MKQIYMLDYIKESIDNKYAMEVLYYTIKNAVITNDYNLKDVLFVDIDGRYHGNEILVGTRMRYRSDLHTISMLLSIRALMLNKSYLKCCVNDHLIFTSIPKDKFQWIINTTIILDCMEDDEFAMLYGILEVLYYEDELEAEIKERFEHSIEKPEYRNADLYYRNIASNNEGVVKNVICDNAFVCNDFSTYEIGQEIVYVGNTAFAYCLNLETIKFNGQVSFGKFPIIECEKLRQIVVPPKLVNYYKKELPFYKGIINVKEKRVLHKTDIKDDEVRNIGIEDSEIEIVYVDIANADPYIEVEIDDDIVLAEEQDKFVDSINIKKFESVFDKKATSYKYFWLMAILTLAKENGTLVIPFKDILTRMAAMAWPLVFQDEINLGAIDQLTKYLTNIWANATLAKSVKVNVAEAYIKKHYESQNIRKILEPLLKNVPYRFLSPWIAFTSNEDVASKTKIDGFSGLYSLYDNYIVLNKHWWNYIKSHYNEVKDFTLNSFISYAQKYNDEKKLFRLKREGWGV